MYSPVSGTVTEKNTEVEDKPSLINSSAEGEVRAREGITGPGCENFVPALAYHWKRFFAKPSLFDIHSGQRG